VTEIIVSEIRKNFQYFVKVASQIIICDVIGLFYTFHPKIVDMFIICDHTISQWHWQLTVLNLGGHIICIFQNVCFKSHVVFPWFKATCSVFEASPRYGIWGVEKTQQKKILALAGGVCLIHSLGHLASRINWI
jgi:hypothetical protein